MDCNDQVILPIIKIIQNAFLMIEIIAPTIAIVSLTIILTKLIMNPDNKKLLPSFKNAMIALVIIFLIPVFINVTMAVLGENFKVSTCWKAASNYKFSKGKYIEDKSKKPSNFYKTKKYEVGDPTKIDSQGHLKLTSNGAAKQKEWIQTLENTADKLIRMHAVYNYSAKGHSLEAVKRTHQVNCATYISFAMQEFGILPKGKVIYINKDGKIKGDGAAYIKKSKKVTISYPDKKVNQLNLKPGDILGFDKGYAHTFAYAGKKSGKDLWYTAGSHDVSEKNYGPKTKGYGNKIIGVVIRPNYDNL